MEEFTKSVKEWVQLDTKLKELNDEVKRLRDMRNEKQKDVISYVQTMERVPKLEISDGFLSFVETKVYTPLSYTFLEQCLVKKMGEKQAEEMIEYIKSERQVKTESEIRRGFR